MPASAAVLYQLYCDLFVCYGDRMGAAVEVSSPATELGFYVRAKEALEAQELDQDLEDELDQMMNDENDALEEAEIENVMFSEDIDVRRQLKTHVTPSEFTEFAIRIPTKGTVERFSFEGRRYLQQPYNTAARRMLLKFSRQCEKSTLLGNKSIAYCGINYGFKVLYVSATATQAHVFSVDRLKEPVDISPELSYLIDSGLSQNVLFKQFKNRSQIRIRYAFLNADRTRGISADLVEIDEIQDIIFQNVPVIEQCASHSDWKLFCYSGTPKSLDNTIEVYWSEFSTQNEWVIPCTGCGKWNILGVRNIGKKGPICAKCGKSISPAHPRAQWASMQPLTEDNAHRVAFEGYHVNQLMVPWIANDPDGWHDSVLFPLENYETSRFNNEVLGLSYDSGQRPLTKKQVEACCQDSIRMYEMDAVIRNAEKCYGGVAAGLDHGTGESESYSVLSLGGYLGGEFQIFYIHRFTGEDLNPQLQLLKIAALLKQVNFVVLGSDYGGGFDRNDWLMRNFGVNKIMKYQYASAPKKKVKWEPALGRFMLHRTEVMADVFNAIRARKIWFPKDEEFRTPYGSDLLNIFSEFNQQIHMTQYKVSPGKSDDSFHSILYCFLASMFIKARPDILVPTSADHVDFTND